MKFNFTRSVAHLIATATVFGLLSHVESADAASIQLIGLTDNNALVTFDANNPNRSRSVGITGITGNLVIIDFRPRDGMLYGLTDTNNVYIINPDTGVATLNSTLNMPVGAGLGIGADFNPAPDRLRLAGSNDRNFRIDVDTGMVTVDKTPLQYAAGDPNQGRTPSITGAAYTNSFAPSPDRTRRTTLYEIDSNADTLITQGTIDFLAGDPSPADSPNNGQLFTVGNLGFDFGDRVGFDILSPSSGKNFAFATSGTSLFSVDLSRGSATALGTIGDGNANIVGLAARSVPEPSAIASLIGIGTIAVLQVRKKGRK